MYRIKHMGRLPHVPDRRDFSPQKAFASQRPLKLENNNKKKATNFKALLEEDPKKLTVPTSVDNTKYDTPIEDQGNLGSCVSFACCGALEYLHNMLHKRHIRFSKLFQYSIIRRMNHWPIEQDTGAFVRSGLGSLVRVGALQDSYWPYDLDTYADEPKNWYFPLADDYETLKYFRLDLPNPDGSYEGILERIKTYLSKKFPVIVGFYCFETIDSDYCTNTGNIPYPAQNEINVGGHCITALGYDDSRAIKNPIDDSTTKGAFLCRNSWGSGWGDQGYAWLPYDYLMKEEPYLLADEFYSITRAEFLEAWQFEE